MRDPAGVLSYYYYDDSGKLFAFDKGGTRYYVATDQVGTPKVVSDAAGNAVKSLEFDSFGMWTFDSNPDFDLPVGFAGGILDTNSLLVRFGYRDYDPNAGRWTAKDPIFFKGGQGNLYGYVENNPVNLIDPLGLERWHQPDGNHTVGRPGTIVTPGGGVGTLIEERVGSGWEFGKKHDEFVGKATQCGIPDIIINIPSMLPVYLYSIAKDLSEMPAESKPGYFPLLEMRF